MVPSLNVQKVEGKAEIDTARLTRLVTFGAGFAPLAHFWYAGLDKIVPGSGALTVAKKVALDQVRACRCSVLHQ